MTPIATATRQIGFDSGHRVLRHESKCLHPHGHRYTAEVTCAAAELDSVGRVIDYGDIKAVVGGWIDAKLDHGYIGHPDDPVLHQHRDAGFKVFEMPPGCNPTAENLARVIGEKAQELLADRGIRVARIRLYETPNCWADWEAPDAA